MVAHLVEEQMVNGEWRVVNLIEAVRKVFNQLEGLNAIAVYFPQQGVIGAFRNGSPMVVGVGDGEHFLASDVPAFLPFTNRVVFLNDGEGIILSGSII